MEGLNSSLVNSGSASASTIITNIRVAVNRRYEYAPIGENQIRIICLQPGSYDDELKCELRIFDENQPIPYDALSYFWGVKQDVEHGKFLPISGEALRRFRHE